MVLSKRRDTLESEQAAQGKWSCVPFFKFFFSKKTKRTSIIKTVNIKRNTKGKSIQVQAPKNPGEYVLANRKDAMSEVESEASSTYGIDVTQEKIVSNPYGRRDIEVSPFPAWGPGEPVTRSISKHNAPSSTSIPGINAKGSATNISVLSVAGRQGSVESIGDTLVRRNSLDCTAGLTPQVPKRYCVTCVLVFITLLYYLGP